MFLRLTLNRAPHAEHVTGCVDGGGETITGATGRNMSAEPYGAQHGAHRYTHAFIMEGDRLMRPAVTASALTSNNTMVALKKKTV